LGDLFSKGNRGDFACVLGGRGIDLGGVTPPKFGELTQRLAECTSGGGEVLSARTGGKTGRAHSILGNRSSYPINLGGLFRDGQREEGVRGRNGGHKKA